MKLIHFYRKGLYSFSHGKLSMLISNNIFISSDSVPNKIILKYISSKKSQANSLQVDINIGRKFSLRKILYADWRQKVRNNKESLRTFEKHDVGRPSVQFPLSCLSSSRNQNNMDVSRKKQIYIYIKH